MVKQTNEIDAAKRKLELEILKLRAATANTSDKNKSGTTKIDQQIEQISKKVATDLEATQQQLQSKTSENDKLAEENYRLQARLTQMGIPALDSSTDSLFEPPPPPPPPGMMPSNPKTERSKKKTAKSNKDRNTTSGNGDNHGALLQAIRAPQALKHVDQEQKPLKSIDADDQNVLNLIAKALIERRNKIKDDQGEEPDVDTEDWL